MDIKKYINNLIEICKNQNITDVEVYYSNSISTLINVVDNEVETFTLSNDEGINLSGNYKGKNSTTYIEKFDDNSLIDAVNNIKETAPYNGKTKKIIEKNSINNDSNNNYNADANVVIDKLKKVQNTAKSIDSRIISVPVCEYQEINTIIVLSDDKGNQFEDSYSFVVGSISVVAQEDGIKKNGYSFSINKKFEDINYETILTDAIYEATSMIKASPIASGNYDVIIRNNVAANMFATFMTVFCADSIKKNTSKFANKINTQVAVENLNIIEDPMYQTGKINRIFDDEGTRTYKKYLIENGVLKNILSSNEYEATTGNAFRNSYRDNISISSLNCYIEVGLKNTDEIVSDLTEAVMITNIDGLHAGMNTVTGDFSLIANGYYIKDGKIDKPVNQITVAGNFYEMLNNIVDISKDVCTSDVYLSFFESPSLLVKGLMIGGL
jgi:PmbA protein